MVRHQLLLALGVSLVFSVGGCKRSESTNADSTGSISSSAMIAKDAASQNLGWLAAQAAPVAKPISFAAPDDSDKMISPGAMVLQSIETQSPLKAAELQTGDVIVRAGETWLPVKDDPTLDLIRIIEQTIDAGSDSIELGYLRDGQFRTASIPHQLVPLDQGLPGQSVRFDNSLNLAVARLKQDMNEDGSFGAATGDMPRLRATSLAGLALIASSPTEHQTEIDQAYQFVSAKLSNLLGEAASLAPAKADKDSENEPSTPATGNAAIVNSSIDALTASYVLQFLVQSGRKGQDANYNQNVLPLLTVLVASQQPSGAWSVNEADADAAEKVDFTATYVTNQALLAVGMLERQGIRAAGKTVERGCQYLVQQWEMRAAQDCDSRTSSALSAGTAAALISLNCHRADETLTALTDDAIAQTDRLLSAPAWALPGLLSTAIVAQAAGDEKWFTYHSKIKHQLVASQRIDGSFQNPVESNVKNSAGLENDQTIAQAHWVKILAMRKQNLPLLTGQAKSQVAQSRNSLGKPFGQANGDLEKQANQITSQIQLSLNDLDPTDPDFEKKLKEKLKNEFGIDSSNIRIQRQTTIPPGILNDENNPKK